MDAGESVSDIEEENGYDSAEELEGKNRRAQARPKFTLEEEREVVKAFDRRLVPFLALLYLLAFLDRSSKYREIESDWVEIILTAKCRYRKCQNCRATGRSPAFVQPIRVATHRVLYHIHPLRMDDPDVPPGPSAYLHLSVCVQLGSCGLLPVFGNLL
jgi:hypothetical protein